MLEPKNTIVILMDSLNRHFLPAYGNTWVKTPNIDRLAKRGMTFQRHYVGSMPCMPARHDLWTGSWEFLWRPWGPVEPGERTIPESLKGKATTQLVTDHYHLFERGGETYHIHFDGWEFIRGHENDPWVTAPNDIRFKYDRHPRYERNMSRMKEEKDHTSPRTFQAVADWLDENAGKHERFYMFVDEFDPHEPFHSSEPYSSMYDPDWKDAPFFWEKYGPANQYSERELNHLRAQYAGKLTMADAWLGRILDRLDEHNLWDSTLVMLTTDHGHFLGEHEWVGKGTFPCYQPIGQIPLIVAGAGIGAGTKCDALTTHVDVAATVFDVFGVEPGAIDGRSLLPLLSGAKKSIRDYALYGWFGSFVNVTDGKHTYFRAPATPDNSPLAVYRMTWTTAPWWNLPVPDSRLTLGHFDPREKRLLGRIELDEKEKGRLGINRSYSPRSTQLFDVDEDPGQERNLASDVRAHGRAQELLIHALKKTGCPPEQFVRLGLKKK